MLKGGVVRGFQPQKGRKREEGEGWNETRRRAVGERGGRQKEFWGTANPANLTNLLEEEEFAAERGGERRREAEKRAVVVIGDGEMLETGLISEGAGGWEVSGGSSCALAFSFFSHSPDRPEVGR